MPDIPKRPRHGATPPKPDFAPLFIAKFKELIKQEKINPKAYNILFANAKQSLQKQANQYQEFIVATTKLAENNQDILRTIDLAQHDYKKALYPLKEFYSSETTYVKQIELLIQVFKDSSVHDFLLLNGLNKTAINSLITNYQDILDAAKDMVKLLDLAVFQLENKDYAIYSTLEQYERLFSDPYAKNLGISSNLYEKNIKTNPVFKSDQLRQLLTTKKLQMPNGQPIILSNLAPIIFQRLPRHELILKEVVKATPGLLRDRLNTSVSKIGKAAKAYQIFEHEAFSPVLASGGPKRRNSEDMLGSTRSIAKDGRKFTRRNST